LASHPARHQARKRFGQNFLTDANIIDRIIEVIDPQPGDCIVEIGPGQGALTGHLLDSGAELHLVEIDRDLAARLEEKIAPHKRALLHTGDALTMDFAELCGGRSFRLVGNLPYNISTPLLFHVLSRPEPIVDMHFMLQREVIDRMSARPGSRSWGRLSIMCQYHCSVTPLFDVPPEAFSPRPRVHSGFVRLVPHASAPVQIGSMQSFQKLVRQAFSMRRKTLRNCLRGLLSPEQVESAGIDPGLRPEMLSLEEFATLTRMME